MIKQYKVHELLISTVRKANSIEERTIKDDMEKNGYDKTSPIILWKNKIIDGRLRYKIAIELNIEPAFQEFVGTISEVSALIIRQNYTGRHLTQSQKAMFAVELIEKSGLTISGKKHNLSVKEAGVMLGVGKRTIQKAIQLNSLDLSFGLN